MIKYNIKNSIVKNMATNNNGTVNIAVYTTLDKEKNKNILSFIVQDEYHLKKLPVGAYSLNILDTQLLNNLSEYVCSTISCGDYVVCHNFTEQYNKLSVILFNTKPTILKKNHCIFKIVYSAEQQLNNKMTQGRLCENGTKRNKCCGGNDCGFGAETNTLATESHSNCKDENEPQQFRETDDDDDDEDDEGNESGDDIDGNSDEQHIKRFSATDDQLVPPFKKQRIDHVE
ncbi:Tlp-20 [Apocheima cinerarium nucleopolyhedrovirus]|uniref:Tlp-20 n=1 Tax=Apocheima cinerarium nucleopolyhedrovirus TaxID=307461 RepID=UPI0001D9208C|nr:Tlp-20 [Apocheima cinerarium nucleopolyhedrovirus]ADB84414.1 Tlp-20 [Apocheima cinerarium nucleopolyhedrovirus]